VAKKFISATPYKEIKKNIVAISVNQKKLGRAKKMNPEDEFGWWTK
jgi:hypothetical protein